MGEGWGGGNTLAIQVADINSMQSLPEPREFFAPLALRRAVNATRRIDQHFTAQADEPPRRAGVYPK